MLRTHNLGEVNEKLAGKNVKLCGWVDSIRHFKEMTFILLRDRYGKVQIVAPKKLENLKKISLESCISVNGKIKRRPKGLENPGMISGKIEVEVNKLEIFNLCPKLPFDLKADNVEDIRLKYRFLDLRTEKMQRNIILRNEALKAVRDFFHNEGFVEIETPILAKSTPEGARDYIVPSRLYPNKFFALPQSPQLFKQLSQIAGFDKYIQIARCFRDEDLRSDRQPEFTQIDVEMSFIEQEDLINVMERMLKYVFKKVLNADVKIPFKRITYEEAVKKYNTDAPDLRKDKANSKEFAFCWVVDFPLFEYSKEEKRYKSTHHPFTMPVAGKMGKLDFNEKSKAVAYDCVLNGSEIGGGSIRISDFEIQEKIFDILKISKAEAKKKFSFLLTALQFGAPPHGGIAFGFDRLVQIMAGEDSIRQVIAFPKNKEAKDLMLDAPSEISDRQLKEIHLKLKNEI